MKSQLKSTNVAGHINTAINNAGIDMQLPKVDLSEATKDWEFKFDPGIVKLPAGIDNYISPLAKQGLSAIKLPSELGNIPLPTMPDLSSVSSKIDESLAGLGIDTQKLGIRSVNDILKEPDLSALKKVDFAQPVDLDNMPDLTKSLDGFDIGGLQSQIDGLMSTDPSLPDIDISQYF